MTDTHFRVPDSTFFVPPTWKGMPVEIALALPMASPDAAGGVAASFPGQHGVLLDIHDTSVVIKDGSPLKGGGREQVIPKSRIWGLSVTDDEAARAPALGDLGVDECSFHIPEGFIGANIDIALALPTGVHGLGGRVRIEYPRQPGVVVAIFPTSLVLAYEQLIKGEKQKRLMLLPKSRIWALSRMQEHVGSL